MLAGGLLRLYAEDPRAAKPANRLGWPAPYFL